MVVRSFLLCNAIWFFAATGLCRTFVHPGILLTEADYAYMRTLISGQVQPAFGSYDLLQKQECSQAHYRIYGPYYVISRDGTFAYTKTKMEHDFSAAYQNALMWMLTRQKAHARKSLEILKAYAQTLREIPSTNDAPLLAGLEGWKICYATEVLHHSPSGMTRDDWNAINTMLRKLFLPICERFFATPSYTNGNWGPIVTKTYLAMAILWEDTTMYNKALDFYLHARDNGTIAHYISGETGQIQESGRDQGHSQLGIAAMATVCEMAWKQGDDLYSALDNRLLNGFEYVACYNLGHDVPFTLWHDMSGHYCTWTKISEQDRGNFKPVYEMVYNHYVRRRGLSMPYVEQVLQRIRPEGYDRDQPGFGSLLFAR